MRELNFQEMTVISGSNTLENSLGRAGYTLGTGLGGLASMFASLPLIDQSVSAQAITGITANTLYKSGAAIGGFVDKFLPDAITGSLAWVVDKVTDLVSSLIS